MGSRPRRFIEFLDADEYSMVSSWQSCVYVGCYPSGKCAVWCVVHSEGRSEQRDYVGQIVTAEALIEALEQCCDIAGADLEYATVIDKLPDIEKLSPAMGAKLRAWLEKEEML